jgi:hypothetical protein
MSHLVLDEIYAVEWKGGRWRLKKSFGTAIKFWGDDAWSNFSTYAKLAIVAMLILGEPSVMQRLEARNPMLAGQINDIRNRVESFAPGGLPQQMSQTADGAVRAATSFLNPSGAQSPPVNGSIPSGNTPQYAGPSQPFAPAAPPNNLPQQWQWPATDQPYDGAQSAPTNYQNSYDTAQRPSGPFAQ